MTYTTKKPIGELGGSQISSEMFVTRNKFSSDNNKYTDKQVVSALLKVVKENQKESKPNIVSKKVSL